MSTQSDIIQPSNTQSSGTQINKTIAMEFLPRLKNKLVAIACSNNQFRKELRDELTKEQSPKRGQRIDIRLPHFLNALDNSWDLSGTVGTTGNTGDISSGTNKKDINSYQEWLLSVALDQHLVLPLKSTATMEKLLVNLDEWSEAAADKLSNRIDNRFLRMLATAGGSGATVTNKNGRLNHNALEYLRGRIEANGEVGDGNLCAVIPTKLRHLITGDLSRGIQQYPEADVKTLTTKGAIPNMLGGMNTYMATYVPTHTCGDYRGSIEVGAVGSGHFLTASTDTPSQGVGASVENEGFRVATMKIPLRGFEATAANTVLVRAGDEFVIGGNSGYANGIEEVNLYNGEDTGNLQVFTVTKDVTFVAGSTRTTDYDVEVSPGLFHQSTPATGAVKGISRIGAIGNDVYFNGRPTVTYDQVFVWNRMDAAFMPVAIPELPQVVNKTVMDDNSGLTFNIAIASNIDDRSTLQRFDGWWGMAYFSYGNNTIGRLRVQAHDGAKDGVRTGATSYTTAASRTAATALVDNADTTYSNHHALYNGGLMPTTVVPVVADVTQASV